MKGSINLSTILLLLYIYGCVPPQGGGARMEGRGPVESVEEAERPSVEGLEVGEGPVEAGEIQEVPPLLGPSTEGTGEMEYVPVIDPANPRSILYLDVRGRLAGRGGSEEEPASELIRRGRGWHPAVLAAEGLPKDRYGFVDWAEATRRGLLQPKGSLDPNTKEIPPLKLDIVIEAKSEAVKDVLYPHEIHTWWLSCDVCHPAIFVPKAGFNDMTMVEMVTEGKWCGRCHGKVAFPLQDCERCHTVPKGTTREVLPPSPGPVDTD